MINLWLHLKLCLIFLKIGATSFGGAYSIWALVQNEFMDKGPWADGIEGPLSPDQFYHFMEVGQLTPGPNINGVLLVGNHYLGIPGIFLIFFSLLIPSVLIMIGFYHLNRKLGKSTSFSYFKNGALAAVIGILVFFLIKLGEKVPLDQGWETAFFAGIALIALYFIHFRKFNVIITTLACGSVFWLFSWAL